MRAPTIILACVGAALVAAFACSSPTSSNNCGGSVPPSLIGTYTLSSYTLGSKVWTSPTSTGSIQYTATTYQYNLRLATDTTPLSVRDSGSYQQIGSTCLRQYSLIDTTHFSGSYRLDTIAGTIQLRESGSDGARLVIFLWTR